MSDQLGLDFSAQRPPETSARQLEAFCAFLKGKGWITAKEISEKIAISDRRLRVLAERSDGRILSGQKGYRIFDETTPVEDVEHAANWIIAQGKKMIVRGIAIKRRYHSFSRDRRPAA